MNSLAVSRIALVLYRLIDPNNMITAEQQEEGKDPPHLKWMAEQIISEKVTGRKAQRWLGYIQAALIFTGANTLNQMKALNTATIQIFPDDTALEVETYDLTTFLTWVDFCLSTTLTRTSDNGVRVTRECIIRTRNIMAAELNKSPDAELLNIPLVYKDPFA